MFFFVVGFCRKSRKIAYPTWVTRKQTKLVLQVKIFISEIRLDFTFITYTCVSIKTVGDKKSGAITFVSCDNISLVIYYPATVYLLYCFDREQNNKISENQVCGLDIFANQQRCRPTSTDDKLSREQSPETWGRLTSLPHFAGELKLMRYRQSWHHA